MNDTIRLIVDKLSQYNFLTNLIPGSVLCILLEYIIGIEVIPFNAYEAGVVFYFAGLVNGRFGSLVVERILKKIKFVHFAQYKDFVAAEKIDSKISTLSQENNTYRSYISVTFLSLLFWVYRLIVDAPTLKVVIGGFLLILGLLILFMFAYRKQTNYVRSRVESIVDK